MKAATDHPVSTLRNLALVMILGVITTSCGGGRLGNAPRPETPVENLTGGDHDIDIRFDGRNRSYRVHVPTSIGTGTAPVLLAFHGGTGNPRQFQNSAGIDAVADREGFIAVYPAGTGAGDLLLTWNAGTECCGRALSLDVDDVGFTEAVVDDLARRTAVDRSRIYATGHSNGAGMVYRIAIEAPGLLAAIAPVSGASMGISMAGAQPIPLLHIHSLDDPRALYDGGLGPPYPGTDRQVNHRAVMDDLSFWRSVNECSDAENTQQLRSHPDGSQIAALLVWDCPETAPVEHWQLTGVGHGWPGSDGWMPERIIGPSTDLLLAAEEVWSFVSRFSLR